MSDLREVSRHETAAFTVTRYESETGALTVFTDKRPLPELFARGVEFLRRTGAAGIARAEANAATAADAEELCWVWDSFWSVDP